MTFEEIHVRGLSALKERLGLVGMIRFLQQSEMGWGDYAKDRHTWLDEFDLDACINKLESPST